MSGIDFIKKATSKQTRKYGKKEQDVSQSRPRQRKDKKVTDMYKILIDMSNFTGVMTLEKALEYIENKEKQAKKERRSPPSMMLVKQ